ncbi:MAG: OmpA family protein [Planctomycetota bacterium]
MTIGRRLRRVGLLGLGTLLSAAPLGGCVGQEAYDELVSENRTLTSRNADLTSRLRDLESTTDSLRNQGSGAQGTIGQLQGENDTLRQQLAQAAGTISTLEEQMGAIEFDRLDPATDAAFADLARRFPGLLSYDAQQGMLRFSSDLTFGSGSAVVRDSARESIRALAGVLRSSEAGQYDVRIVGHTDSQRPSARTRATFPTNMHLATARAISVRDELLALGVPAERMEAAGWGPYRPLVANTATGNTPRNRRVELFLVPTSVGSLAPSGAPTGVTPPGVIDRDRLGSERYVPTK